MKTRYIALFLAALITFSAHAEDRPGGAPGEENDNTKFDSAHAVVLDATITNGLLLTRSLPAAYTSEIRAQLNYLVGQLNHWQSAPQLAKFQVSVGESHRQPDGFTQVHYAAKGEVSWSRSYAVPATFETILPARGDAAGIQQFFAAYSGACAETSGTATLGNFWYHFRPLFTDCPLSHVTPAEAGHAARTALKLAPSGADSQGKSPEYGELWKDGKLTITVVVGKYLSGATDPSDAGIAAYNELYSSLRDRYGAPATINVRFDGSPGAAHPELTLTFAVAHGTIDVALFLVNQLSAPSANFTQKYAARSLLSDAVIYDGHAGLGENVRALNRLGKYAPGKYQVFMVNGCDSFAYVDDALFKAHAAVNPGSAPAKFVDVVSNAMPAYFTSMSGATMAMISALDEQRLSYREILAGFDPAQRAVVAGEEDNLWPAPFH